MKNLLFCSLLLISGAVSAQTIMKNVPIISDDAYVIKLWTLDEETQQWRWGDVYETGIEQSHGWIYNQAINTGVERYDVLDLLFIRGFDDCADTTRVKIHGNYDKTVIKDKKDFRKVIRVDGSYQVFGVKAERPKEMPQN